MTDLAAFLTARLDEEEVNIRVSRMDDSPEWWMPDWLTPTRLLAEIAAKRAILAEHDPPADPCDAHDTSFESIPCDTVRHLAAVYAEHPDYDEAWRP